MLIGTDPVLAFRKLRREAKRVNGPLLLAAFLVFGFSLFMYHWEFQFTATDLSVHARIASEFDFTDLHSITSRIAYPLWHLLVAGLLRLGMPLWWASAVVCACAKTAGLWLVYQLMNGVAAGRVNRWVLTLGALLVMFVTGVRVPGVNDRVYAGIGSPTVWHNPTQLMVNVSLFLCVPYVVHCFCEFERRLPEHKEKTMVPWYQVGILAVLLMASLACKPTVMQALIPAAGVFFLWQWVRHPNNSRFFGQMILAFLPAVAYFVLQYLYYTGVVVSFSSGVETGLTAQSAWLAVRNMLLMAAFPLFCLLAFFRKGLFRDRMLSLTLLMVLFSVAEAMFFRETGMREGHGNFNWASMSSALMLWVLTLGYFLRFLGEFWRTKQKPWHLVLRFGLGAGLLGWHAASGVYYVVFLLQSHNAF